MQNQHYKMYLSAASVLRFKGAHVNSWVLIVHLICVHGCSCVFFFGCHPVIEFPKTRLVCWLIFLLFDCKNCVLVTSCRSRSDCSSTGWLFLEWNLETAKPQIFGKTQVWRALFEISLNAAQRGCFFGGK